MNDRGTYRRIALTDSVREVAAASRSQDLGHLNPSIDFGVNSLSSRIKDIRLLSLCKCIRGSENVIYSQGQ